MINTPILVEVSVPEKIQKFREYLDYIERHFNNVQKAWQLIQDKCRNKGFRFMWDDSVWASIESDVVNHDMSKLSAEEFTQYRQYFYPCKNEVKNKDLFFSAWRHHKDNNIHHWQNWTTKCKGYAYRDSYVVMMLVDWVAMGFEFNDTAQEYYEKNKGTIDLPEWAEELMYRIFEQIYPS